MFAETKQDIKSKFIMEYTYDCSQIRQSMNVGKICIFYYLGTFLVLVIYNCIKHKDLDDENIQPEHIELGIQRLLISLIFICILHRTASLAFEENCPWKMEDQEVSVFME